MCSWLGLLINPTTNKFGFKYILVGARVTSIAAVRIVNKFIN